MRALRGILTLLSVAAGMIAKGQNLPPDTVWLKDGSYYAGWVMELVPGAHVHVRMPNSNNHVVPLSDVARIRQHPELAYRYTPRDAMRQTEQARRDTMHYRYRPSGVFHIISFTTGYKQVRLQTVHGYKFNNWAQFGGTIGLSLDFEALYYSSVRFEKSRHSTYVNMPVGIYLHGDLLKSQITPYYSLGIGGALNLSEGSAAEKIAALAFNSDIGFGVRFHSRGRPNFNIGIHADIKNAQMRFEWYGYNHATQRTEDHMVSERSTLLFLGLRIGVGF